MRDDLERFAGIISQRQSRVLTCFVAVDFFGARMIRARLVSSTLFLHVEAV
ncbi:MAG: hypothetical protein K2Y27_34045 [Xanthobacteraceae bacterium]|nr:hypothetical protein [Xanthobacteraceae bacterium]